MRQSAGSLLLLERRAASCRAKATYRCWSVVLPSNCWRQGEVTFIEMWMSALQLGLVRSNFVDTRNGQRYLFAERSLGCIPMSNPIRHQAARVRLRTFMLSLFSAGTA